MKFLFFRGARVVNNEERTDGSDTAGRGEQSGGERGAGAGGDERGGGGHLHVQNGDQHGTGQFCDVGLL